MLTAVRFTEVLGLFNRSKLVRNKREAKRFIIESARAVDLYLEGRADSEGLPLDYFKIKGKPLSNRKAGLLYLLKNSIGYVDGCSFYIDSLQERVFGITYVTVDEFFVQRVPNGVITTFRRKQEGSNEFYEVGETFKVSEKTGSRNRGYKFFNIDGLTVTLHSFIYFSRRPYELIEYISGEKFINHCVTRVVESDRDGVVCYSVTDHEYDFNSVELVSNKENVDHGRVVKENCLDNLYLSAKDLLRFERAKRIFGFLDSKEICALIYLGSDEEKFFDRRLVRKVERVAKALSSIHNIEKNDYLIDYLLEEEWSFLLI